MLEGKSPVASILFFTKTHIQWWNSGAAEVQNFEIGYELSKNKFFIKTNLFLMNYKDQLALTGEINDVGAYNRINVDKSSRMGVEIEAVDDLKAKKLNLPKITGVFVTTVLAGSAAQKAGLKNGDVISKINDEDIKSMPEFTEKLGTLRPGDKVVVDYYRDGLIKKTTATLLNQLNSVDLVAIRKDKILTDLGFELREQTSLEKELSRSTGVIVISVFNNSTQGMRIGKPKAIGSFS